jgi:hypothetical protein
MGASTSDVGYTSATTGRRDHEVYMDMWWQWGKKHHGMYSPNTRVRNTSWRYGDVVNRSEDHVKISVQYLRSNSIRNVVQYFLPLVLLFLGALLLTVVGILCTELLSLCVFVTYCLLFHYVCSAVLHGVVAVLLASSQYPEGPALTGHLGTGFCWFPCV